MSMLTLLKTRRKSALKSKRNPKYRDNTNKAALDQRVQHVTTKMGMEVSTQVPPVECNLLSWESFPLGHGCDENTKARGKDSGRPKGFLGGLQQ